jgi:c-di-GMP-related signal transduction protein
MTPKSINVAVAEKVQALGSQKVVDAVVEKLVTAEVAKRADALAAAIKLSEDTLREQRKAAKPDVVTLDAAGNKSESFTAKAFEAKKKLDEKLAKIDSVVTNAVEKGEWGKLYELVKNGGTPAASTDESATA